MAGYLAIFKTALPGVAKQAGVLAIVSKWELGYQSPEIEVVDVTPEVAALFHPGEKMLGNIQAVEKNPPLPIEQITDDVD